MKKVIWTVIIVLAIAFGGLLFHYGTVSPCGILKKEMRSQILQAAFESPTSNKWEMVGLGLGAALAGPMIDSLVDSLTPMQCTKGLYKLQFEGKNIFADKLNTRLAGSSNLGSSYSEPTKKIKPTWYSYTKKSPIDDSTNVYLSIDAEKPISGWLHDSVTPSLHVRCKENKTNVFINLNMRPKTEYGSYGAEYSYLRLRYDDEKAYKEKFGLSTDGEAVFFTDNIPTVKKMLKHKELLIEVTPFNSSPQITTFSLSGLRGVIGPLREACHW
jgi:hypothetical protein